MASRNRLSSLITAVQTDLFAQSDEDVDYDNEWDEEGVA
jgi:hypothetical protein